MKRCLLVLILLFFITGMVPAQVTVASVPKNYPNPFKPGVEQTTINYSLSQDADTQIYIYNLNARIGCVKAYLAGSQGGKAGENEVSWDGIDVFGRYVPNGVYIYFIVSGGRVLGSGELSIYE